MSLNDRKRNLSWHATPTILCGVALKSVFIRSAYSRHFHSYQHTTRRRIGQRVLTDFVTSGFDQSSGEHACARHKEASFILRPESIACERNPGNMECSRDSLQLSVRN